MRMRRSMVSLVVGVVLAILSVALMYNYVQTSLGAQSIAKAPPIELVTTVVAAKALTFGTAIEKQALKTVQWPKASLPADAFSGVEEVFAGATAPGDRIALIAVSQNEPVTKSKVSGFGARPTLSRQVENGMRAISIRVDDVVGVAGFVLPGDRVDIMLTRRATAAANSLVNEVILQNIAELGINQNADQAAAQPIVARTATVEVTPEQAQKLVLAQQAGNLSLALRSVETAGEFTTRPITEADLGALRPTAVMRRPVPVEVLPPPPAPPPPPKVRVRYATTVVEKEVRP
jgi:pilus assembly protein CpaB